MPDSFAKLASLKRLWLEGCENLMVLLVEFGKLDALDSLDLTNCVRLEKLPDSFAKSASLKRLLIIGCENLVELPVEFRNLHGLEISRVEPFL